MRKIRLLLVLGLLGGLTAGCGSGITDVCGTEQYCYGKKLSGKIYQRAEKHRTGEGAEKDTARAVQLHRQAAERGHLGSQYRLAESYRTGAGVAKDPVKAVQWHRKAAEEGHLGSQFWLAESYRTGEGDEKNPAKAVELYRIAA